MNSESFGKDTCFFLGQREEFVDSDSDLKECRSSRRVDTCLFDFLVMQRCDSKSLDANLIHRGHGEASFNERRRHPRRKSESAPLHPTDQIGRCSSGTVHR